MTVGATTAPTTPSTARGKRCNGWHGWMRHLGRGMAGDGWRLETKWTILADLAAKCCKWPVKRVEFPRSRPEI